MNMGGKPRVMLVAAFALLPLQVQAIEQNDFWTLQEDETPNGAPIEKVLEAIKAAIKEAEQNTPAGFPKLRHVKLTLQTTAQVESGPTFKFLIFTLGSRRVDETASFLKLTMEPPASKTVELHLVTQNLKSALAEAVNVAKAGFVAANKGDPKLSTRRVDLTVKFAIARTRSGDIDSGDLLPIGIKATRRATRNQTQEVALVYCERACK